MNSVVFLYQSLDALEANAPGGTGFIVQDNRDRKLLITNIHVAAQCKWVKIKGSDGPYQIEIDAHRWIHHPDGDDISVLVLATRECPPAAIVLDDMLATEARMAELNAGVGDEVFMLGRLVSHSGQNALTPLARFGNIAMMPGEPIVDGRNLKVDAFLVEMRSVSGFSGSPVFIYIGPGTYRGNGTMMPFYSEQIGLIGIDAGHKQLTAPVEGLQGQEPAFVKLNSGISIVVPYTKIKELVEVA
jgi:hypothetical protein